MNEITGHTPGHRKRLSCEGKRVGATVPGKLNPVPKASHT